MTNYAASGVNVHEGDKASALAYGHAMRTHQSRAGLVGQAKTMKGAYAGLIDMGDYYLVQNDDGVGTKIEVAIACDNYKHLGTDLLAMLCDDAVCMGAEVISITNTIDTNKVDSAQVDAMMDSLATACEKHRILISGGEIAELSTMMNATTWNGSAVGLLAKDKVIDGSKIQEGMALVGFACPSFRSNGLSLARYILKNTYGDSAYTETFEGKTWGEILLQPCTIYASAILDLIGRFGENKEFPLYGLAHMTGGGMRNLHRLLKNNTCGLHLTQPLAVNPAMKELQRLGNVSDLEAYQTWNMGMGMLAVTSEPEALIAHMASHGVSAHTVGAVTARTGEVSWYDFTLLPS